MEKPSTSNFQQKSVPGRRVRLIPATPRPEPQAPSSSSSSTDNHTPSPQSSSSNPQSGNPRRVLRGANPAARLPYPYICRTGDTGNEEFQPPVTVHPQFPSTRRRVRRVPTAPQPNAPQDVGTSRPPEKFGGNLCARIIREAMAKIIPVDEEEDEVSSEKNPTHASSSSLRFSTDGEDETRDGQNGRRKGRTFKELATEVIREMRRAEEKEEGERPEGTTRLGEPSQPTAGANNEDPHEGLIREILDLTGTDDEIDVEEDEWNRKIEETVDTLVAEMAEQCEQVTRLVDLVGRVVSWMDKETQSSNNPSPATSVAPLTDFWQPNADLVGPSRKRKSTATTSQAPSAPKKTQRSDSSGGQKDNEASRTK